MTQNEGHCGLMRPGLRPLSRIAACCQPTATAMMPATMAAAAARRRAQRTLAEQPPAEQHPEQDADLAGRRDRADGGEAQGDQHQDVSQWRQHGGAEHLRPERLPDARQPLPVPEHDGREHGGHDREAGVALQDRLGVRLETAYLSQIV